MTFALVQSNTANNTTGTTLAVTLGATTAHNLIIAVHSVDGGTSPPALPTGIQLNTGQNLTMITSAAQTNPTASIQKSIWYLKDIPAGATSVTSTIGTSGAELMEVMEFSGADTVSPLIAGAIAAAASPAGTQQTSYDTTPATTVTPAGSLWVAGLTAVDSGTHPVVTNNQGYTQLTPQIPGSSSTSQAAYLLSSTAPVKLQSAHNSGTGTSITVTLGAGTTTGSALVVFVGTSASTNGTISGITLGGVADHFVQEAQSGNATDHAVLACWTDPNCAAGQTSVVITTTGSAGTQSLVAWVEEWAGLPLTGPLLDKSATLSSAGFVSTWTLGPTATTTQVSELWLGAVVGNVSSATPGTYTGPVSPWTNEVNLGVAGASVSFGGVMGYQAVTSTGTVSYNGSVTPASTIQGLAVSLKAAAAPQMSGAFTAPAGGAWWSSVVAGFAAASSTTNISVSDIAAGVESQSLTVTVPLTENAGQVESNATTVTASLTDAAGQAEAFVVNAVLSVADSAGQAETSATTISIAFADFAAAVESYSGVTITAALRDVGAQADTYNVPNNSALNPNRPAIVLVAAAYAPART